ncbi:MAG: hypothetical protein AAF598_14580 [Bacteroidota bacterium]
MVSESCYLPEGSSVFCSPTDKESRETIQYLLNEIQYAGAFQIYQTDQAGIQAAIIQGKSCLLHGPGALASINEQYSDNWGLSAQLAQAIYYAILYQEAGDQLVCAGHSSDSERFVGHVLSILGIAENALSNSLVNQLAIKAPGNTLSRVKTAFQESNDLAEAETTTTSSFVSPDLEEDAKVFGNFHQRIVQAATFPMIGDFWTAGYQIQEVQYAEGSWFIVFQRKAPDFKSQALRLRDKFPENEIDEFWKKDHDISRIDYLAGQWYLCMTQYASDQQQLWRKRIEFPEKEIEEQWKKDFHIVDLSYGNGVYTLVMSKKPSNYRSQIWFLRNGFPEAEIKEHWAKGHEITEIEYINGQWALVMTKYSSRTIQKYLLRNSFPYEEIEQLTEENYRIEHVSYANGQWLLVFTQQSTN